MRPINVGVSMNIRPIYTALFLCLILAEISRGQSVNFEDGFEDGDFTTAPAWAGDVGQFAVIAGDPNHLLQLQGSTSGGVSYISTPSSATTGSWEFYFRYTASSAPSSGNRAEIFLMSDRADLESTLNGYALQIGQTGDDFFELVRYDNGSEARTVLSDTTLITNNEAGYRVKVNRTSDGQWSMEVGTGYDGVLYNSGNTATDSTHATSTHFGVVVTYTSTRLDKFFFDFKIDLPPFAATAAQPAGNGIIDLFFNRAVDPTSVSPADFTLDHGIGAPSSISFKAAEIVQLNFGQTLPSEQYLLSVGQVSDQLGFEITEGTRQSFIIYGRYTAGDVKINEFAYDPPVGQAEYVEIINTSNKYLNLSAWKIGDDTGTDLLPSQPVTLDADSFLVISSDTAALFNTYGGRAYFEFPGLASFNNSGGDAVHLVTENGETVDSLFYSSDWGGTDVALERRSASAPAVFKENWGNSTNIHGGTPGAANVVLPDKEAPSFEAITAIDAQTLQLNFSERITSASATIENFEIQPYLPIQLSWSRADSLRLLLNEPLESQTTYTVTAYDIADIFGNTLSGETKEVTYISLSDAQPGEVVINEILYRPGTKQADFVELYNNSPKNFDITGWLIGDATRQTSIKQAILPAHGFLVLTGSPAFTLDNGMVLDDFPSFNNYSGDAVYLQNASGQTIDSLYYSTGWGGGQEGTSIERKDPLAASNDASNWETSTAPNGFTAGKENAVFREDLQPPQAVFSKVLPSNQIALQFNEFVQLNEAVKFTIGGKPVQVTHFDSVNANILTLQAPQAKADFAENTTVTIRNISDVKGNTTSSTEIAVAQRLQPSDLVINEIMYNPLNKSDDNKADQSEYIELHNIRDYAVSLEGLMLHDAPDEDGKIRTLLPVTTTAKWIPAHQQALIYADEAASFINSKIARFFEMEEVDNHSLLRVDRSGLSLASAGDAIYIADSTGTTIDSVFYDESWQNPNLIDSRGIALERISPSGPGNKATNWGSSVNPRGGTPAGENSLYQENTQHPAQPGISFTPNPFSPDGDGFEDNLFINYRLDQEDYLIKVRIYDRYGRLVRNLADGQQAGFEGQLIWDGRKTGGSRNRIGIYIVAFEAYDSTTGKDRSFKETVVLARKLR